VEFFWTGDRPRRRLLNIRKTGFPAVRRSKGRKITGVRGTGPGARALSRIVSPGRTIMRNRKPLFNDVLTHFLMGVALGLFLVLLLTLIDTFHVRDLVAHSGSPVQTIVMLISTYALMFGIGAALTGLVLALEEDD
jgi:hypothetical protein